MYRLKEDTMAELEIKKSRFLCYLHKSFSEADAKEFIQDKSKSFIQTQGITAMPLSSENRMSCSEAMTMGSHRGQPVSPCWNVWQTVRCRIPLR